MRLGEDLREGGEGLAVYLPSLHYSAGEIAAVLTLDCEVFGAGETGGECWDIVSTS